MSDLPTSVSTVADRGTSEAAKLVEEISRADAAEATVLRTSRIPSRIGMAAAARLLAEEVGRWATEQVDARTSSGEIAEEFEESRREDAGGWAAGLLREQAALIVGRIRARGEQWLNDSLRLQGQADALEQRLVRLTGTATAQPGEE